MLKASQKERHIVSISNWTGSNDMFPSRCIKGHAHFTNRGPMEQDRFNVNLEALISICRGYCHVIHVYPILPRHLAKTCLCSEAAYYPGSVHTASKVMCMARDSISLLNGEKIYCLTDLFKGLFKHNPLKVEKWQKNGLLPLDKSLNALSRGRCHQRRIFESMFAPDYCHFLTAALLTLAYTIYREDERSDTDLIPDAVAPTSGLQSRGQHTRE